MAANTPIYRGAFFSTGTYLQEVPESGMLEISDRITFTTIYEGKHSDCLTAALFKGVYGSSGPVWNLTGYRVLTCTVTKTRGAHGRLTTVWEGRTSGVSSGPGTSPTLPEDTFDLSPAELNPDMKRHPYWFAGYNATPSLNAALTEDEVAQVAQVPLTQYGKADNDAIKAKFANLTSSYRIAKALKLGNLLAKGVETFLLSELEYTWVHHQWTIPTLNRRAYLETVPTSPLSSALSGFTSLRVADRLSESNGYYTITRKWLCVAGSDNRFDSTLYNTANAP